MHIYHLLYIDPNFLSIFTISCRVIAIVKFVLLVLIWQKREKHIHKLMPFEPLVAQVALILNITQQVINGML